MKKRGQSAIITTVLIILIVLVSIVIVWNVVQFLVNRASSDVDRSSSIFGTEAGLESAKMYTTGDLIIKVRNKRGSIDKLNVILYDIEGKTQVVVVEDEMPEEQEALQYIISSDKINSGKPLEKITVVPVIGDNTGIESQSKEVGKNIEGEIVYSLPDPNKDIERELLINNGLLAWWNMDEVDSSGNILDHSKIQTGYGTVFGDAHQIANGKFGKAFSFDGDGDYILINSPEINNIQDEITVSLWVNPTVTDNLKNRYIIKKEGSWFVHHTRTFTNTSYSYVYNNAGPVSSPISILNSSEWHYLAFTYNQNTGEIKTYYNGYLVATRNLGGKIKITGDSLYIGTSSPTSGGFFEGKIDEVMIFEKELSEETIKQIYLSQK
jgi:hypothetical protein